MDGSSSKKKASKSQLTQQTNKATALTHAEDPAWKNLVSNAQHLIVDPADVHSVIDERLADSINQLSPAEVTMIQRRGRDVIDDILGATNGLSNTGNGASGGFMGRFTITGTSSSNHDKNGINLEKESRNTYQTKNRLDENVVRKIFAGGHTWLRDGQSMDLAEALKADYLQREGFPIEDVLFSQSHDKDDDTLINNAAAAILSNNSTAITRLNNSASITSTSSATAKSTKKGKQQHAAQPPSQNPLKIPVDPIGSAYLLLSHLSEDRWDRVQTVALLSAKRAGLDRDVNSKKKNSTSDKAISPPPLKSMSPDEYGDELAALSTNKDGLPGGVSFVSLCFLISQALCGTRKQRLNLLFYLLLPPPILKSFLESHPGGGVPTWLLEVENDTVLSFSSLSHYFYFGSSFLPMRPNDSKPTAASTAAATDQEEDKDAHLYYAKDKTIRKHMPTIKPRHAIDAVAILLSNGVLDQGRNDLDPSWGNGTGIIVSDDSNMDAISDNARTPTGFGIPRVKDFGEKESRPAATKDSATPITAAPSSSTITSQQHRNSDMTEYLQQLREGAIVAASTPQEQAEIEAAIDDFWKASLDLRMTQWTIDEFSAWADKAISDTVLDIVMHRLFGTGILPSPAMERELVVKRWQDWHKTGVKFWTSSTEDKSAIKALTDGFKKMLSDPDSLCGPSAMDGTTNSGSSSVNRPWGGIGGIDDRGGLGHGVMFCVSKTWWDQWLTYIGYGQDVNDEDKTMIAQTRKRPHEMSTEELLDRSPASPVLGGTMGFFEPIRTDLTLGEDYVLIPPGVWDILYELYGGGPPLPRMVLPPKSSHDASMTIPSEAAISSPQLLSIPKGLSVATHPWVLQSHLCDPHQPYRRGDAGPITIRVMATEDQPLWRFVAELITRLPIPTHKTTDEKGEGWARLWKRIEPDSAIPTNRYGPWALVCKNRHATIPLGEKSLVRDDCYEHFKTEWQTYADHGTLESVGLGDGGSVMVEFAVIGKDGQFAWPREAAAKAGKKRRLEEEDLAFRQMLRGVDVEGKILKNSKSLIGTKVDALDLTGRWYQLEILDVDSSSGDTEVEDSDNDDDEGGSAEEKKHNDASPGEIRTIRVEFSGVGGHEAWIDVNSDRLAVAGRFTLDSLKMDDSTHGSTGSPAGSSEAKAKSNGAAKKTSDASDANGNNLVCTFPGYGAIGLSNLGNTCYANAAWQCLSYIPLLRSYLISGQYKTNGDLNKDNPLGTGGKLLEEYAELLRTMWSGRYGVKAPSRFRSQLGKARSQYSGADQQDAQELLNDMLDVLHEDSNKILKKPYVEAPDDDWVTNTELPRVGLEAWRRFLRRNRSVVADIAMGQVLNRVTCPICNHTSRNFDPFNMLSIPFPTVAEVIFRCTVVRRGTATNCLISLGKVKKSQKRSSNESRAQKKRSSNDDGKSHESPPSNELVFEQYIIAMSRLADIGDLKLRLQNISGISSDRLKLCKTENVVEDADLEKSNPLSTYVKVSALPDKEGPCVQLVNFGTTPEDLAKSAKAPTHIIAFENTISPRPASSIEESPTAKGVSEESGHGEGDESSTTDEENENDQKFTMNRRRANSIHKAKDNLKSFGDRKECRLFDTDPTPIARAMSRSLWPRADSDFKLGLRVDAIDHRDHWFPGSVVEIIEDVVDVGVETTEDEELVNEPQMKVRIHFDNFSSKWDETYSIEQFKRGQVRPLYSHATPRARATEFLVHHRYRNRTTKANILFGQAFFLQCENEWSTARAGAHILAQASRFLQPPLNYKPGVPVDNDVPVDELSTQDLERQMYDASVEPRAVISEIIDILLVSDRQYVESALALDDANDQQFNAAGMSSVLSKKLSSLLPRLPFDVRVCTADQPLGGHPGGPSEEVAFPFSLVRTIGNYMNARHAVVLHWRLNSSQSPKASVTSLTTHYVPPTIVMHKQGLNLLSEFDLDDADPAKRDLKRKPSDVHGGMHLGVCLTEFCKEQQLPATDCWRCPKCKEVREGLQSMALWKLPDMLTFHIKRFNCSARWREKITTKINFPLTGLDMSEWCDEESPAQIHRGSFIYDLIGVVNHYGGMTGGHYVATCKATACGADGSEEVAYNFNGAGVSGFETGEMKRQSGWRLGRSKEKDVTSAQSQAALSASRSVASSTEPLWLQFDDDLVEPIPPKNVVSEMAYVLFYQRRGTTPSNIAKYSTLN